jgi:hypothetical protein
MYKPEPILLSSLSGNERRDSSRFDPTDDFDTIDDTWDNPFYTYPHCNTVLLLEKRQQCPIDATVLIPESF